jgi:two-component system nitrogen regulation response regulator GlnG
MPTLLAIDDEPGILYLYQQAFEGSGVRLLTAGTAAEGLAQLARERPDVVLLDIDLPDQSGLEAFRRLQALDAKVPVIFVTGHGTTSTAIRAMSLGAYEYLLKPVRLDELKRVVGQAFEVSRLMRTPAVVPEKGEPGDADTSDVLVGRCPAMQDVYKAIGRVAPQDVTVLILGESGTGKELVARALYHYSRREKGPFLAVNCAALPDTLLESELFGHEKGSFTGADRQRIGKFEQCKGGTLFLDEIGDMTPLTQAKVLRVLQEQQFERVGGSETVRADVRVIAATNRNLEELVRAGRFRGDLYYRLNVFTIRLPALRERLSDLPLLVSHFLRRFGRELGKHVHSAAPEALDLLRRYPWPGNVRELQSVLKQALLQTAGPVLLADFLPATVRAGTPPEPARTAAGDSDLERFIQQRLEAGTQDLYAEWQAVTDRQLLGHVLRHTDGNLSAAAKILGINRLTLRSKIRALGIDVRRPSGDADEPAT